MDWIAFWAVVGIVFLVFGVEQFDPSFPLGLMILSGLFWAFVFLVFRALWRIGSKK